jgi:UPF0755 protein
MARPRTAYYVAAGVSAFLTVVALAVILADPGSIDDVGALQTPASTSGDPILIEISEGDGPSEIAERLENRGVIESGTQFRVLVNLMGYDRLLQAGEYEFAPGTPAMETVYRLRSGLVSTKTLTVIEGWRLDEIADAVAGQGILREEFIAAASRTDYPYAFLAGLPEGATLEGYLYPATYTVRTSDTAESVVLKMLEGFDQNVAAGIADQAAALGLSMHDAVTLASIIQREAQVADEKPIMAQVFETRLLAGITLDADPTVQYAITEDPASVAEFGYWKPGLTLDDLVYDSLYNTYQYFGLPPGPISNPGVDTMLAVVQPADTLYLYFVARPDGSHAFAETYEEHLSNVEAIQGGAQ